MKELVISPSFDIKILQCVSKIILLENTSNLGFQKEPNENLLPKAKEQ